jgi:peroxiredoxin
MNLTPLRRSTPYLALALLALAARIPARAAAAPDWQLKDLQGHVVKFSDFKGKVVIIDFWESYCAPCCWELSHFVALQDKYGKQGLAIIGIAGDWGHSLQTLPAFIAAHKINYTIVLNANDTGRQFGATHGVPDTFIIDRNGNIVAEHLGFTKSDVFEKEIQPLL